MAGAFEGTCDVYAAHWPKTPTGHNRGAQRELAMASTSEGTFDGHAAHWPGKFAGHSRVAQGAFAMAGAPALAAYVGGTLEEATRLALEMYEITLAEHPHFTTPQLNYRGTPTGVDVRKVVERN